MLSRRRSSQRTETDRGTAEWERGESQHRAGRNRQRLHRENDMRKRLAALAVAVLLQTTAVGAVFAQAQNGNPLSDVRVRQAIAYAIDRNLITESVFGGFAVPATGLL